MDQPTMAVRARALRAIAHRFQLAGLATLEFELLAPAGGNGRFDVPFQAERLAARWFAIHALGEEATCVPARD